MHILRVCKKYGYSLDSLHHLFHSLIIPAFTYAFQYGMLLIMISIFPKLTSFRKEQFVLVSFKEFSPVLSLLEASYNRLWKSITTSTKGPLVDLLTPSKTRLLRNRGHSRQMYFLKLGLDVLNALSLIDASSILFHCVS